MRSCCWCRSPSRRACSGCSAAAFGGPLVFLAHAVAGFAIVALLLPKARIIRGVLRRPAPQPAARRAFLTMAGLALAVLVSGVVWAYTGPVSIAGLSLINWHAFAAVLLTAILAWHVSVRRPAGGPPAASTGRASSAWPAPSQQVAR